jgi:protease I
MEMAGRLDGKKVAILVTDGFEQVEMTEPRRALDEAGADTVLVSPKDGRVKGWQHTEWGDEFAVDRPLASARADDFDALLLPGGVMNPDHLRQDPQAVSFVRDFFEAHKPVAAICHGPWTLVEAGVAKGRTLTSYPSVRTDLRNAGATVVDEEVVIDGNLISSRSPDDLPAFCNAIVDAFAQSPAAAAGR